MRPRRAPGRPTDGTPAMPASDAQRAKTAQRRAQCLEMVLAGARWDTIADKLGYAGKAAACKDFQRAMDAAKATTAASAAQIRDLELLRLDRLQAAFWRPAMRADHRAGRVVLDVHDRRVKLLDLTGSQKTLDNAVDAWVEHLRGGELSAEDQAALDAVA
jgi:hypothetical protein